MKPAYLYVFEQKGADRIKIGYTTKPVEQRRKQVQRETKLHTVTKWVKQYDSRQDAYHAEQMALTHFDRYRTMGEYFQGITVRDVKRYFRGGFGWWKLFMVLVVAAAAIGFLS